MASVMAGMDTVVLEQKDKTEAQTDPMVKILAPIWEERVLDLMCERWTWPGLPWAQARVEVMVEEEVGSWWTGKGPAENRIPNGEKGSEEAAVILMAITESLDA